MDLNEIIKEIEKKMKKNGYKCTHSRKIVIKLLAETSDHLRCEDIYQRLRDQGVSLPTVYRNIEIFKRLGIVKEVVIHNDRYFELNMYTQKKLHIHFHCHLCGQIKEYSGRQVFRDMILLKEMLESKYGDNIEDINIVMAGICMTCNDKSESGKVKP